MIATFPSQLGYMALATFDDAVLALTFGYRSAVAAERALKRRLARIGDTACDLAHSNEPRFAGEVQRRLERFAAGVATDFDDLPVNLLQMTVFQRQVIGACRAIAWGETSTYGELAANVGHAGAARAVGTVMSQNRIPLIVPCHRVLAAGGRLGGYSAPDGLAMKRRLLDAEQLVSAGW